MLYLPTGEKTCGNNDVILLSPHYLLAAQLKKFLSKKIWGKFQTFLKANGVFLNSSYVHYQGQLHFSGVWTGISWKGSNFLISWVHSSSLNNSKMNWDKLWQLSFTENLGYLWLFGVGFMEKSLSVFEWQLFEKKCAKHKFLVLVKEVHFLAFQFILEICPTLHGCGVWTTWPTETHGVSLER